MILSVDLWTTESAALTGTFSARRTKSFLRLTDLPGRTRVRGHSQIIEERYWQQMYLFSKCKYWCHSGSGKPVPSSVDTVIPWWDDSWCVQVTAPGRPSPPRLKRSSQEFGYFQTSRIVFFISPFFYYYSFISCSWIMCVNYFQAWMKFLPELNVWWWKGKAWGPKAPFLQWFQLGWPESVSVSLQDPHHLWPLRCGAVRLPGDAGSPGKQDTLEHNGAHSAEEQLRRPGHGLPAGMTA